MTLRESLLTRTMDPLADGAVVTLDPGFQGLPDMAHGGTVLALFDAVAAIDGARRVRGHYMKRVPLASDLTLRRAKSAADVRLALVDRAGVTLVDGVVSTTDTPATPARASAHDGHALPVSRSCFVCGTDNEVGLRAALTFDAAVVGGVWRPRAAFRAADGTLAPIALTGLLDEAAFWLGALATGESGMTTELEVTLLRPASFGTTVTIAGDRRRVAPRADDPRYVDTEIAAFSEDDGAPVAIARITFVAVRGAARRLASWLEATNSSDTIRRVFPRY